MVRGNCTFGMFSNYPENVDDALRQRAGARFLVDGPQSREDYIDILSLLLGKNHAIPLGQHDLFAAQEIKRAVTDSGTEITFDESRPAITNLLTIYQLLTVKTSDECVAHFAGKGYGDFKGELAETTVEFLRPFQERVHQYDDATLGAILESGAEKARTIAAATLKDVYEKVGMR